MASAKSNFDPESFLNTTTDQANSTDYILVPEGEYTAVVKGVKMRVSQKKDGSGEQFTTVEVNWEIDHGRHPEVKAITKRNQDVVPETIFLDLTADGTGLDMSEGKNVPLGRWRKEFKQNQPGMPWNFKRMEGTPGIVSVTHTKSEDKVFAKVSKSRSLI